MPPPPGPASVQVLECSRRAVEERLETSVVLRAYRRVRTEEHAAIKEVPRTAA